MSIYKILLKTTNGLKDSAQDKINNKYIDVDNGYIYVSQRDLEYVMKHFEWESIEAVGLIFERPCEIMNAEEVE